MVEREEASWLTELFNGSDASATGSAKVFAGFESKITIADIRLRPMRMRFCLAMNRGETEKKQMTREQKELIEKKWFQLPLDLRRRYWKETDYGRKPENLSEQLLAIILKAAERPS